MEGPNSQGYFPGPPLPVPVPPSHNGGLQSHNGGFAVPTQQQFQPPHQQSGGQAQDVLTDQQQQYLQMLQQQQIHQQQQLQQQQQGGPQQHPQPVNQHQPPPVNHQQQQFSQPPYPPQQFPPQQFQQTQSSFVPQQFSQPQPPQSQQSFVDANTFDGEDDYGGEVSTRSKTGFDELAKMEHDFKREYSEAANRLANDRRNRYERKIREKISKLSQEIAQVKSKFAEDTRIQTDRIKQSKVDQAKFEETVNIGLKQKHSQFQLSLQLLQRQQEEHKKSLVDIGKEAQQFIKAVQKKGIPQIQTPTNNQLLFENDENGSDGDPDDTDDADDLNNDKTNLANLTQEDKEFLRQIPSSEQGLNPLFSKDRVRVPLFRHFSAKRLQQSPELNVTLRITDLCSLLRDHSIALPYIMTQSFQEGWEGSYPALYQYFEDVKAKKIVSSNKPTSGTPNVKKDSDRVPGFLSKFKVKDDDSESDLKKDADIARQRQKEIQERESLAKQQELQRQNQKQMVDYQKQLQEVQQQLQTLGQQQQRLALNNISAVPPVAAIQPTALTASSFMDTKSLFGANPFASAALTSQNGGGVGQSHGHGAMHGGLTGGTSSLFNDASLFARIPPPTSPIFDINRLAGGNAKSIVNNNNDNDEDDNNDNDDNDDENTDTVDENVDDADNVDNGTDDNDDADDADNDDDAPEEPVQKPTGGTKQKSNTVQKNGSSQKVNSQKPASRQKDNNTNKSKPKDNKTSLVVTKTNKAKKPKK